MSHDSRIRLLIAAMGADIKALKGSSGGAAPLSIPAGSSYTVPVNKQVPYRVPIRNAGLMVIDGLLEEV